MSQFGQPPLAAYLPLRAGQNLSDLPDKAAALTNLGTLSTSDIMLNSVPIGTIIPFWGTTAPVGYLPCNGQTVNSGTFPDLVTFLGGGASQALPDLRGEFLRGWDNGRGVDIGRAIKTAQAGMIESHTHAWGANAQTASGTGTFVAQGGTTLSVTASTGGVETRPRNISVLYCMKAYGALINTSTANMGNVLTELSQCTKLTQFGSSLVSSGYQRQPSGMILQWGKTAALSPNIDNLITLPISFPTACLIATVSLDIVGSGAGAARVRSDQFTTSVISVSHTAAGAQIIQWIAIGY